MKTLIVANPINIQPSDILYFDKNPKVENVVKHLRRHFEELYSNYTLNFDNIKISFERKDDYDLIIVDDGSKYRFLLELRTIVPIF